MDHEFLGVVEEVGSEVAGLTSGDLVVAPFAPSKAERTAYAVLLHGPAARSGGADVSQWLLLRDRTAKRLQPTHQQQPHFRNTSVTQDASACDALAE
ncbi:hypothetical protein M2283_009041 [Streptomyces pseudovenezuelae]|uniref:Uncharacterized protein n=1 Tax=Streptomyces pseudovenezuelae TaxID=67350 RepID=A0ABT6LZF3_9ACTN|nr:hypothetical protein [Streptomyces pseudovenezuelae]